MFYVKKGLNAPIRASSISTLKMATTTVKHATPSYLKVNTNLKVVAGGPLLTKR